MEINLEDVFSEENNLSAEAAKLRYHLVEDHVNDVITIFNLDLKTIFKSPSIMQLRGFTPKEAKQQTLDQIMAPDDAALFQKTLLEELALEAESKANHKRAIILEAEEYKKDGSTIVVETKLSFLRKDNGVAFGIIAVSRDITERKRLSITDDLTQLYNSKYFYNQLGKEIERSNRHEQPLTLLMLDIDKFKDFNDTYGHIDGDNVLLRLGQVLKRCLRETDSAYRYGGEEFTILLPMTTSEEGIVIAKRIQTELRKEAFSPVLGQKVYMTVSIGLSQYKPKEEIRAFVHRVDQIMYKAKKGGRNMVCSEPVN